MDTFQDGVVLCKSAATPLPTLWFLTTNESFQMRYCLNFFFKGHQNCQKSNIEGHEKSCFIKWIWKAKTLTSGHSGASWGKSSYSTSFESSIMVRNHKVGKGMAALLHSTTPSWKVPICFIKRQTSSFEGE